MRHVLVATVLLLSMVGSVRADDSADSVAQRGSKGDPESDERESGENTPDELRSDWSLTFLGQYTTVSSPEDDDDVAGWFDQYEFTPNKSSSFPFQIGIRDAAFDLFRGDTALFQARLASPTANLGISGSQADDPFFNQRLDSLTRLRGVDIDLSYRRMRTEQLRLFPNTEGGAILFDDRTRRKDRFHRDRTGFDVEARVRPYEALELFETPSKSQTSERPGGWLRPELSLRGGHESRDGKNQLRFIRDPSNQWLGVSQSRDRSVSDVGGGVLVAPNGLFTLSLDFDHERVRSDSSILTEGDLGYAPPQATRTIGFVPETDRNTGTIRFNSRLWDRAVVEGGFQVTELEQVSAYTPDQRSSGLTRNEVRYYSANAAVDVQLVEDLSFNGSFKFDRRENDINRNTSLFNDTRQVDPFVEDWQRFVLAGELELRFWGANRAGLGMRFEDVSRDLDYSDSGRRILPANAQIDRDSRIITLYGRTSVRPWRRLRVDAELGYRWAPETGYATELNDNLYGELRASYVFALPRPIVVSGYLRGGTGDNEDFSMVSGQGPVPVGAVLPRSFERSNVVTGFTASISPIDRLSVSTSFFFGRDDQDVTLDLSTLQRYFQDNGPIDFTRDGKSRFENKQTSVVLGLHYALSEKTDGGISYSFTHAEADYSGSDATAQLDLVADSHRIDSDTHVLDFEVGHQVMQGLRVLGGYRFQRYKDREGQPQSVASAARSFNLSTNQHTVSVGVTLTADFFQAH